MKKLISLLIVPLPWFLKRLFYTKIFKYKIHSKAKIGLSWIFPDHLIMDEYSRIGSLTICKNIKLLHLGKESKLGSLNWITGFPLGTNSKHFASEVNRIPQLLIKDYAAITGKHFIDCTNSITIGEYTTVAGIKSQLLTHSINLKTSKQESSPIEIGKYCFIGTSCVFLRGSKIPDYSIVGAMSLVNKQFNENNCLYGGVPVKRIKKLDNSYKYFERKIGFVY